MKIKVIGGKKPWLNGQHRDDGFEGEVSNSDGAFLIQKGMAEEVMERARKDNGTYQADDPATPENEAYEAPKKRGRPKKAQKDAD